MAKQYFVSAIGTDSGKTVVCAILAKALHASYWKPVQSGLPADSDTIRKLVPDANVFPEKHRLSKPLSPHHAAMLDEVSISLNDFQLPTSDNLIVEGAGGLLVPLSGQLMMTDLIKQLNIPLILVANFYLGSINHTLLSLEYLRNAGLRVHGVIYTGEINQESYKAIEARNPFPVLAHIPYLTKITPGAIAEEAKKISL